MCNITHSAGVAPRDMIEVDEFVPKSIKLSDRTIDDKIDRHIVTY